MSYVRCSQGVWARKGDDAGADAIFDQICDILEKTEDDRSLEEVIIGFDELMALAFPEAGDA